MLCVRNRFLFTTRLYEQGGGRPSSGARRPDTAVRRGGDSILIAQAKHFTLLVGNYSREGFNHPGPAYLYVQAIGEYLFQDLLHVVPTAWNAHMLSVFALDSAFVALAVGVVYGWTRSVRGAAACFAVFIAFAVAYPPIVNSDWMPYMYVPAYVVFLLAAASVVAGRGQDAWVFALSGSVPTTTAGLLPAVRAGDNRGRAGRRRCGRRKARCGRRPGRSSASAAGSGSRSAVISAVFALTDRRSATSCSQPGKAAATACARWCGTRCTSGGRTRTPGWCGGRVRGRASCPGGSAGAGCAGSDLVLLAVNWSPRSLSCSTLRSASTT